MANTPIPLFSATHANRGLDFLGPLKKVLDSNWYILGEEVKSFERAFASYLGTQHCVSVANGSDAIELALRSVGVTYNDTVITVANAGFYSSTAIRKIGAIPRYVDVDFDKMTMSPAALEAELDSSVKAIIVTHLYGQLANIEKLTEIARQAGIPLIEDCAQSHGARNENNRMAGSFGDVSCFSFYPTKNLGALGDGGAVSTSDDKIAERLLKLRQYGWSSKYTVYLKGGGNSRLDEMQAAILNLKLPCLDSWNAQRRNVAKRYNEAFAKLPIQLPPSDKEDYVAHLYIIRTDRRSQLSFYLSEDNIASDIHYPIADHKQPAYLDHLETSPHLPITENCCATVLSLPCFPGITLLEVDRVIASVRSFFAQEV